MTDLIAYSLSKYSLSVSNALELDEICSELKLPWSRSKYVRIVEERFLQEEDLKPYE